MTGVQTCALPICDHTRAFINGNPVDDWGQEVSSGDLLTLHQVPSGLGLAANLAIAALAVSVATFFLFAPEEPEISDDEKRRRVKGDSNQNKAYEPIPYVLGKRKIVPAYAANPYYEYRGKDQYYRMLLCVGYGPMNVTDVRIGEYPSAALGKSSTRLSIGTTILTPKRCVIYGQGTLLRIRFGTNCRERTAAG